MKLIRMMGGARADGRGPDYGVAVCGAMPSLEDVVESIARNMSALVPDASVVARRMAIPGAGVVDILAAGPFGRPIAVCADRVIDPASICRALVAADWITANIDALSSAIPRARLAGEARAICLGVEAAPEAASLMRRIGVAELAAYAVGAAEAGGRRWLVLRRIEGRGSGIAARGMGCAPALTEEEIASFLSPYDEEGDGVRAAR